jgi:hypothetical protein
MGYGHADLWGREDAIGGVVNDLKGHCGGD